MPVSPEPCLKNQCRSPVACEGWGYCRERNEPDLALTEAQIQTRRNIAYGRRIRADRLKKNEADKPSIESSTGGRAA